MRVYLRVILVCTLIAVGAAVSGAVFLWLLHGVALLRERASWIVFMLPLAGVALGFAAYRWAEPSKFGANLVVSRMAGGSPGLARRMAPYALFTTVVAHLFGASVGREGTAVQMGGSIGETVAADLGLSKAWSPTMVAVGAAAGFSAVFGAPLAGAVFACEVQRRWGLNLRPIVWALPAAYLSDWLTRLSKVPHTRFPLVEWYAPSIQLFAGLLGLALAISLLGYVFLGALALMKPRLESVLPDLKARLALGGFLTIALWLAAGTSDYLGLGTATIERAMVEPLDSSWSFAWKWLFTVAAIGTGFPGGEVTPLFFMGASLGNVLAPILALPMELAAGVALFAMFAGPAGTPLAMAIMAAECMGPAVFPYALFVCLLVAFTQRGMSLYPAQLASTANRREAISENEVHRAEDA